MGPGARQTARSGTLEGLWSAKSRRFKLFSLPSRSTVWLLTIRPVLGSWSLPTGMAFIGRQWLLIFAVGTCCVVRPDLM